MRHSSTLSIGWGVPKASIAVASVANEHEAAVMELGTIGTRHADIDHLVRPRHANATPLVLVSEAGPWGYWLSRDLTNKGHGCWVGAPSCMPHKAGDRVHTDRREAVQLARLGRSGDLTSVAVPQVEDQAIRDLTRAREEALGDRQAAKFRLNAFLLRHAIRYPGRTRGPDALRQSPTADAIARPDPLSLCPRGAAAAGGDYQRRQDPCA